MTPRTLTRLFSLACAATTFCPAQQTRWVVDGAGTGDFLTIQEGVDAAMPGDIVFVAPFLPYGDAVIDGKGIFLESRTSWLHFGRITVRNLPAGQTVAIAGFQETSFVLQDCLGDVHIGFTGGFFNSLQVQGCDRVVFNGNAVNATKIHNSRVLITNSLIQNRFGGAGLTIVESDVTVVNPFRISGGTVDIFPGSPHYPVPAIDIKNSTLRIIGLRTVINWGATCDQASCVQGPSILATGEVHLMLSESVQVNRAIEGDGVRLETVPDQVVMEAGATAATDPQVMGVTGIDVSGTPGDMVFLFASPFSEPTASPFGDIWLSLFPGPIVLFATDTIPAGGDIQLLALITHLLVPGQIINWQCVVLTTTGELGLSAPLATIALDFRTHP